MILFLKRLLKWSFLLFFGASIWGVIAYRWLPVYITPLMVIRCVEQIKSGDKMVLAHHWIPFEQISKDLPIAVLASEDQRFLEHHGFDIQEIKNATIERLRGKRRRGGSTISQQTAKNVFLWPSSTWLRKGLEAYFTVLIELCWDKRRIMEVYLNSIEMGQGIYGAEAVAQKNFGVSAKDLNTRQCALIAATLPNPRKFDSAHPSVYMLRRRAAIEKEMKYIRGLSLDHFFR